MAALKRQPVVPDPSRVRRIAGGFGWIDHRLLREGHLERLTFFDIALYLFLVIVANRDGVSWYRKDVISKKVGMDWSQFETAKARLLERGLIAFKPFAPREVDGFYQVLPLPPGGAP